MINQVIQLIIDVLVFACIAAGLYWICKKFELPQIVLWICGGLLLILVLLFASGQLGSSPLLLRRT